MSAEKIPVAIVGASGYTGMELVSYLLSHPKAELVSLLSAPRESGRASESAGRPYGEIAPRFRNRVALSVTPWSLNELRARGAQGVFLATPHEVSLTLVPELLAGGFRVVDLSGAFRLQDAAAYPTWYGFPHTAPEGLKQAVYGLPELFRAQLGGATCVANPGCYATAAALALAPVVRSGQLHASLPLIVDAKSGVSGAGRTPTATTHFCEAHDDLHAYGVTSHRHTPEIRQTLGTERVLFTPHLVPMNRGIFVTCYAQLRAAVAMDEVRGWFHRAYAKEHFIRLGDESLPAVRNVAYTNYCDIGWRLDSATGMLIVCAAIDNLGKGAAGQAVQNFNAMFQMHEALGLERG